MPAAAATAAATHRAPPPSAAARQRTAYTRGLRAHAKRNSTAAATGDASGAHTNRRPTGTTVDHHFRLFIEIETRVGKFTT